MVWNLRSHGSKNDRAHIRISGTVYLQDGRQEAWKRKQICNFVASQPPATAAGLVRSYCATCCDWTFGSRERHDGMLAIPPPLYTYYLSVSQSVSQPQSSLPHSMMLVLYPSLFGLCDLTSVSRSRVESPNPPRRRRRRSNNVKMRSRRAGKGRHLVEIS